MSTWKEDAVAALGGSIEHWVRMRGGVAQPLESPGWFHCKCCRKFSCTDCPIRARTRLPNCSATPYAAAHEAWDDHGLDSRQFIEAAADMVFYLQATLCMVENDQVKP